MKSIAIALAAGVLVAAAQGASADAFPQGSQEYLFGQTQSTYVDQHPVTATRSVFPEYRPDGWAGLPAESTYADAHRADPVRAAASAFPQGTEEDLFGLTAQSTYADTHLQGSAQVAQPTEDTATSAE